MRNFSAETTCHIFASKNVKTFLDHYLKKSDLLKPHFLSVDQRAQKKLTEVHRIYRRAASSYRHL